MERNFESRAFKNVFLDKAYHRALDSFKVSEVPMEEFSDVYDPEEIRRDQEYVRQKEEEIRARDRERPEMEEVRKLAVIFEGIFYEQAETNEWLGSSVITMKSSPYDDLENKVDSLAEFQEDEDSDDCFVIGIDVTTSIDPKHLAGKFQGIKRHIRQGKLSQVKYFKSGHTEQKKKLFDIPQVVIGADLKTVRELSELYLAQDNKKLAEHPVQFQILDEIAMQLETFADYATERGKISLARVYARAQKMIEKILSDKLSGINDAEGAKKRDDVFYEMQSQMAIFDQDDYVG